MPQANWSVQDAKSHFSEVVDAASRGNPQTVTKHGKPSVVIVSVGEYERLRRLENIAAPSFAEHLLAMPADGGAFDSRAFVLRDVEF